MARKASERRYARLLAVCVFPLTCQCRREQGRAKEAGDCKSAMAGGTGSRHQENESCLGLRGRNKLKLTQKCA